MFSFSGLACPGHHQWDNDPDWEGGTPVQSSTLSVTVEKAQDLQVQKLKLNSWKTTKKGPQLPE